MLLESGKQINLKYEYMDTKRVWDAHYLSQLCKLYRHKYADHHFDAIIASDDHALQFLRAYHRTLFSGTPVVFFGVNSFEDAMLKDHPLFTGVLEACDIRRSIEIALTLQPHLKTFYVLVDHTVSGQANKKLLVEATPFFKERVSFVYLENLSMAEACRTLATLPPNSASILLNFTTDTLGNFFSFQKSAKLLSSAADIPMYSFWDFYLGHGIIKNHGGFITVSIRAGQGNTFNIHLPASESDGPGNHDQASSIELCKGSETIRVIDDEKHNLELSKEMLELFGYTVLTADGGRKALEIYCEKAHAVDMVVLDIVMPDPIFKEKANARHLPQRPSDLPKGQPSPSINAAAF